MGSSIKTGLAMVVLAFVLSIRPAAANKYLDDGIKEYNLGHYSEAIGLLGEAEPTEFNNPVLHYYLGNAFSKTHQKDDAVKEYKIALALEPRGQIAEYCERALRLLHGVPPAISTSRPIKSSSGYTLLSPPGAGLSGRQTPRIISILCGCPLCHRLESILHDLEAKYGDRITFTRAMKDTADPDTKQIIQDYAVEKCPTVLIFDSSGSLTKERDGLVAEADLRHDAEVLVVNAGPSKFSTPADQHMAQLRDNIVKEAEARVSDDQRRVDEEIRMIQNEESLQLQDLSHRSYFRNEEIMEIREEARKKIEALRKDMERRRVESFAAASAKIQALESTSGGRLSPGTPQLPGQTPFPGGITPGQR
jgi:tetratricopeptide (TPR) repeat protein